MSQALKKLAEAYHVHGHLYCEKCEGVVDLSVAETFEEAKTVATDHHKEFH